MPNDQNPDSVAHTLAFPFRGPKWQSKLLVAVLLAIGGLFTFFITTIFLNGYMARLMRRVIREGGEPALPEWYDWGRLFVDGLKLTAAGFIYALPAILLFGAGYAVYLVPVFLGAAADTQDWWVALSMLGMGAGWCLFGIATIWGFLLIFFMPAALAQVVYEDSFAGAFHIRRWWAVFKRSFGGFVVAALIFLGLLTLIYMAYTVLIFTLLLCWLAPVVLAGLAAYVSLVYFALAAEAYRSGMPAEAAT